MRSQTMIAKLIDASNTDAKYDSQSISMNKQEAIKAFKTYVANYDSQNVSIALKISHTFRVAAIAEKISPSSCNSEFAWFLGLLHDIGRFEQIARYGTFKDALSIDHAELGADILFRDGLIKKFPPVPDKWLLIAEAAIRSHNKLRLPTALNQETKTYCNILRDADKLDIFRVLTEPPYDRRELHNLTVRSEVMQCINEHRCVPRPEQDEAAFNELEALISQICMAFELVYPESRRIAAKQGYLKKLLLMLPGENPESAEVVREIDKSLEVL